MMVDFPSYYIICTRTLFIIYTQQLYNLKEHYSPRIPFSKINIRGLPSNLNLKSLIIKSVSSVLLDIKKDLISNIFVCGGNSLIFNNYFNDIKEALSKELVSGAIVRLTTHPSKIERSLASFLGASIISSLNIYKETIVKKEEYEEHGSIIIEKKCA